MTCPHMEIAKGLLLKSIAVVANSDMEPARKIRAISSALADLDEVLRAKNHEVLVGKSAWLIDIAKKG
jgi:hypothetical protein